MTARSPLAEHAEIRVAVAADVPAIAHVHATAWREAYQGILPENFIAAHSAEQRAHAWRRILAGDGEPDSVFVAELDGAVVGFGSCCAQRADSLRHQGYDGDIGAIYVLRMAQRQGLGSRLMSSMATELQARGHCGVALWVLRDNAQARRFYEGSGGLTVAERTDPRGEDLILNEVAYGWADLSVLKQAEGSSQ